MAAQVSFMFFSLLAKEKNQKRGHPPTWPSVNPDAIILTPIESSIKSPRFGGGMGNWLPMFRRNKRGDQALKIFLHISDTLLRFAHWQYLPVSPAFDVHLYFYFAWRVRKQTGKNPIN
jgi:hypothetical protein